MSSELQHVRQVWATLMEKSPIYQILLGDIDIVSASPKVITARFTVKPVHLNSKGTLHGSVGATLTDWAGGLAIASTGREKTGVSTDIHTLYISTAKEGDVLEVEGRATKVGQTLAFTSVQVSKVGDNGTLSPVCTGTHTKYVKQ